MRRLLVVAIVALAAVVVGCGDGGGGQQTEGMRSVPATEQPTTTTAEQRPLRFRVIGQCTPRAGVLTSESSGFTPNGEYYTEVVGPGGKPYPPENITNPGYAAPDGTTPDWSWGCAVVVNGQRDKPGRYRATITDVETGRQVSAYFTIDKP